MACIASFITAFGIGLAERTGTSTALAPVSRIIVDVRVRTGQQLIDLYATQLDLYAKALQGMLGIPVTGKILYSFTLRQEVPIP